MRVWSRPIRYAGVCIRCVRVCEWIPHQISLLSAFNTIESVFVRGLASCAQHTRSHNHKLFRLVLLFPSNSIDSVFPRGHFGLKTARIFLHWVRTHSPKMCHAMVYIYFDMYFRHLYVARRMECENIFYLFIWLRRTAAACSCLLHRLKKNYYTCE